MTTPLSESLTDRQLADLYLANGDQDAFTSLVHRHGVYVLSVCRQVSLNEEDAEDMASKVFTIMARHGLKTFRWEAALKTLLYRVARNLSLGRKAFMLRRKHINHMSLDACFAGDDGPTGYEVLEDGGIPGAMDTKNVPRNMVQANEFEAIMATHLTQLSPKLKDVYALCAQEHLGYEEISKRVGLGMGTVKSRMHRARTRMSSGIVEAHPEFTEVQSARRQSPHPHE